MNNYSIKVFEAAAMSDSDLRLLESELRLVMSFIKNSDSMERLERIINEDEGFKQLDSLSVCVINVVTDAKLEIDEKEGTVDMCQAISDMRRYSRAEGRAQGKAEGKAEGRAEGEANEKRRIAVDMLRGGVPRDFILKYLKLSEAELDKLAEAAEE